MISQKREWIAFGNMLVAITFIIFVSTSILYLLYGANPTKEFISKHMNNSYDVCLSINGSMDKIISNIATGICNGICHNGYEFILARCQYTIRVYVFMLPKTMIMSWIMLMNWYINTVFAITFDGINCFQPPWMIPESINVTATQIKDLLFDFAFTFENNSNAVYKSPF